MAYTDIDKPSDYFNTKLYTGTGASNSITGVGFQPDWTWIKNRSITANHHLFDVIRGATKYILTNSSNAEATDSQQLQSFDSDGFTVGTNGNVNGSGNNIVAWNWLASNTTASNTVGDINSTVSVNITSGFSIVSWTGNGTAGATIGHSLGTTPSMIITKSRSAGGGWYTYHKSEGATKFLQLNNTDASSTNSTVWNNTEPTSSVFSTGTAFDNGTTYIAYCFAEKKGFSKFGSYVGNGNADGSYIHLGFKPAFVIIKPSSYANSWLILDNKRNTFNPTNTRLEADGSGADYSGLDYADFLSNGFKIRTSNAHPNNSGGTLIYMAFAESPFTTSTGIPTTAR